jgi:hypothetical protein
LNLTHPRLRLLAQQRQLSLEPPEALFGLGSRARDDRLRLGGCGNADFVRLGVRLRDESFRLGLCIRHQLVGLITYPVGLGACVDDEVRRLGLCAGGALFCFPPGRRP